MAESSEQIDFEAFCNKDTGSQVGPMFWVMSMIITNHYPSSLSPLHIIQHIFRKPLESER